MQKQNYDIAVIIINYNSSQYTINCIYSIIEKTSKNINYSIVIIDNNSLIDDFKRLQSIEHLPQVTIFRSKINLGFSGGNMLGVQFAEAKYYYFLNNDCLLINDCLSILFDFCQKNSNAALCSGQMYDENKNAQITFGYFPNLSSKFLGTSLLRFFAPEAYPIRKISYTQPLKVDLVSGSSMFVQATIFNRIGGFDTNYFFYCEEEDIAIRIHHINYDVYLIPEAKFQHLGGKSTNRSLAIEKEFYISFLYFYRKNYGRLKTYLMQLFLFFKLARKTFRHKNFLILAFFVIYGAPLYKSLKYKQSITQYQ